MKRVILIAVFLFLLAAGLFAQQYTIKFATLAPEGSTWIKIMREYDKAVREQSGGRLGFKIYAGGVAGDEKDVVRKIRLGQYQAGGFTGVGIGEIAPEVRILDAPFLFRNYNEVDYIIDRFQQEFEKAIEDGGFVLLGWAEVGFVYVYTAQPVYSPSDMKSVKMWMWEGDPIAQSAFKAIGITPIPLSVNDVMMSLQTGMINGVYTSPLALIALQWFTRVKYMMNEPLADSQGAVLISKKVFDSLPKDLQQILVSNGRKYFRTLTLLSREENAKAIRTLKQKGIIATIPTKGTIAQFDTIGKQARQMLVGKLFTQAFLDKVETALQTYRKTNESAK
ncbi:MAG: TRAP transporter substrate-binding protein DctP [Bacteroidota bacterium]